jgi:hypothetical protein
MSVLKWKDKEEREMIEKFMRDLGYKQFDKQTLIRVFRQIKADPVLGIKYGLTPNKIEQYQRKYGINDPQQKGTVDGLEIQKYLALKTGGSIFMKMKPMPDKAFKMM